MNERAHPQQKPVAFRRRAAEFRTMAETARTEGDVRSLRVLADRFDRFAEQLEAIHREEAHAAADQHARIPAYCPECSYWSAGNEGRALSERRIDPPFNNAY